MTLESLRSAADWSRVRSAFLAAVAVPVVLSAKPASAETRGYVISWFATAVNAKDFATDCPETAKTADQTSDMSVRRDDIAMIDGKRVSERSYPASVQKDPGLEMIKGKYAYGFDLGGSARNKFIDPETGEKIDNQLWRAVGCHSNFARHPPPERPYGESQGWEAVLDNFQGWAMQISGADLSKDGPVTITLDLTLRHLERDAISGVRSNVTYVLDPAPRSHSVLQGEMKEGVLRVKSGDVYLTADFPFYPQIDLTNTHMRMETEADGKIKGYWGGLTDWNAWVYFYTARPANADPVAYYWNLRKLADFDPDPETGQNRRISTTWRLEAVPAYFARVDGTIIATASHAPLGYRERK